jgi:NADPH2:quinone reductase
MKYVGFDSEGGPEVLRVKEGDAPQPRAGEVLIAVIAAGVSRADTMQRQGNYPPPPGASPILGLEAAGTIAALGEGVTHWKAGDEVCALVNGGGYAQYVTAPEGQALPVPEGWSPIEAASLPENAFTVYDNLITRGGARAGETVLVHGGTSGIGSTAIMFGGGCHDRSDGRQRREVRGVPALRCDPRDQLSHAGFRRRNKADYRRTRRGRRARHRRRRLCRA